MKDTYTHGHHASVLKSHTWRTAENSCGYLLPHLRSDMRVLDVGCGPATITCDLASRVDAIIGIEPTHDILTTAEANRSAAEVDNVTFQVGDVYSLDFDDASFDVVHAHQVLQHLTDPVAALKEMVRVVAPGGIVAVRDADYHAMSWFPQPAGLDLWMAVYQRVARHNGAEPDAARHLLSWAAAAGIPRDQVTPSIDTWLYCSAAERDWWGTLWAERSLTSAFGEQARNYGIATDEDQRNIVTAWNEWKDHPSAWFTVPNGELFIQI